MTEPLHELNDLDLEKVAAGKTPLGGAVVGSRLTPNAPLAGAAIGARRL
jgi:hypothetical protein